MSETILEAAGVGVSFGRFVALRAVSATFQRGELAGIIGPNGAGKSTFFNTLSGQLTQTTGRITFEGRDITGVPQHRYARLGIGPLLAGAGAHGALHFGDGWIESQRGPGS